MARTVYFAGSEPDCVSGNYTLSTAGVDTNFVRTGLYTNTNLEAVITLLGEVGANSTEGYWLHFRKYQDLVAGGSGYVAQDPLLIYDGSNNLSALFRASSTGGTVVIRLYASNGSYVESATDLQSYNYANNDLNTNTLDIHVYNDANGKAKIDVHKNGNLIVSVTNTGGSNRGMQKAVFRTPTSYGASYVNYHEFIVANFDTRGLRVGTYIPSADGTYTDGSGTYADIDETSPDGNAITLAAVGDKQSYTVSKLGNPSLSGILAIAVNGLVASDGTHDLQAGLRMGGVDYFSSALNVGAAPSATSVVWNVNPADGGYLPQNPATSIEVIYQAVA